jgi:hypothetical protein
MNYELHKDIHSQMVFCFLEQNKETRSTMTLTFSILLNIHASNTLLCKLCQNHIRLEHKCPRVFYVGNRFIFTNSLITHSNTTFYIITYNTKLHNELQEAKSFFSKSQALYNISCQASSFQ